MGAGHFPWLTEESGFCLTRMRPPLVKRHTPPESGCVCVFRLWRPDVVSRRWRGLPGVPYHGAAPPWPHPTRREVLATPGRRVQRRVRALRPSNRSVPAYRPRQRWGATRRRCPGVPGAGAAPPPQAVSAKRRHKQERERRAQHRSRCEGPGRLECRRGRTVAPRLPGALGAGATKRHHPDPWGSARGQGGQRAACDSAAGRSRGRWAGETGEG
jgi:hypothetical protein